MDALALPVLLSVPLGLFVYAVALVRLGGFPTEDRALVARLLGRRPGPAGDIPTVDRPTIG